MKLIIEHKDVVWVRDWILSHFGVELTEDQTKQFMEEEMFDSGTAAEAFKYGWDETETRGCVLEDFYSYITGKRSNWGDGEIEETAQKAKEKGYKVVANV